MSDIEGKAARVAASECGQRASFNGANGMSDIEGKAAREAASECGQRASFNSLRRDKPPLIKAVPVPACNHCLREPKKKEAIAAQRVFRLEE
jgi:hypothetical protein